MVGGGGGGGSVGVGVGGGRVDRRGVDVKV